MHLGQDVNVPERVDLFFLGSLTEGGSETDRINHDYTTIARLQPGVSFAQAAGVLARINASKRVTIRDIGTEI